MLCLSCRLLPSPALAQAPGTDLSSASLEALTQMKISVSSFSRKDEDLWLTPAAVFVVTKEDIANSAVSSIPELLRMVPGLQVAQIDASNWAISARGFNSQYANKLLVLIDGRTVYSEIYSGAHWDQIDLPLQDIERIEVIRGPGAAVWGTNAVNGVINIITKKTRNTMGPRISGSTSRIGNAVDLRYGGSLGQSAQYRGFASYVHRSPLELQSGGNSFDGEDTLRGGGRLDWQPRWTDTITTSGELYKAHLKQQIVEAITLPVGPNGHDSDSMAGGYLLSRWVHKFKKSDTGLQVYYDDQSRHELGADGRTRTFDVDFQDHLAADAHNDLVWGAEYRFTANHIDGMVLPTTRPDYRNYLADGFLQDEITAVPHHLFVTLGSKIQDGTLAGFQIQPSARILWAPNGAQSFWAAVSRANVAPSVEDRFITIPINLGVINGFPATGVLLGNPAFKPEIVLAYEGGYRRKFGTTLTLDLAGFFNMSRRIQSVLSTPSFVTTPDPHIAVDLLIANAFHAKTAGVEGAATWKPLPTLTFQGSYAWMQAHINQVESGAYTLLDSWNTPHNAVSGSASWGFARQWTANAFVTDVGRLGSNSFLPDTIAASGYGGNVPAYTRMDFHVSRKLGTRFDVDAGATNLLTPRHLEFGNNTGFINPSYVPRSAFVKAIWNF